MREDLMNNCFLTQLEALILVFACALCFMLLLLYFRFWNHMSASVKLFFNPCHILFLSVGTSMLLQKNDAGIYFMLYGSIILFLVLFLTAFNVRFRGTVRQIILFLEKK